MPPAFASRFGLGHEYSHVIQFQLQPVQISRDDESSSSQGGWILEGSAVFAERAHDAWSDGKDQAEIAPGDLGVRGIRSSTPALRNCTSSEGPSEIRCDYWLGALALTRQSEAAGADGATIEFYRLAGVRVPGGLPRQGLRPQMTDAFEAAFGQNLIAFEEEFEAWQCEQAARNEGAEQPTLRRRGGGGRRRRDDGDLRNRDRGGRRSSAMGAGVGLRRPARGVR